MSPSRVDPGENGPLAYVLFNNEDEDKTFHLPTLPPPWHWSRVADTSLASPEDIASPGEGFNLRFQERYKAATRSSVLLWAVK